MLEDGMTSDEKRARIDVFEKGGNAFDDVLSLTPELRTYRPFPDAWTTHEHIVHFLEAEVANFHRYRRAVAQPETAVLGFDQVWTSALDYHSHDIAATVALIRHLRSYAAAHLRILVDRDWTKLAYVHSGYGRIDLEAGIESYIDHVRFHRELIDRNVRLWNQRNGR
jgi:hypothetical protein